MSQKKSIVVIEDDKNIAQAEKIILEREFSVNVAHDGKEGLDLAQQLKPDVVILDIMMPKLSGYDVCKAIRASPDLNHTKIIMVTAKDRQIDELHGMDLGADDYIMKPFEPEELRHVVHQVLKEQLE
ncbi:MAG: response regulator [archaeon]